MSDIYPLPHNLKKCRKAAGMTQAQLAERVGISQNLVSNWEHPWGLRVPDVMQVYRLAEVLGCTTGDLLKCEEVSKDDKSKRNEKG